MGDPLLPHSQAWQPRRAPKPHKRGFAPRFCCVLGLVGPNAPDLRTPPPTQQAPGTPCVRCSGPPCLRPCPGQWALDSHLLSCLSSHVTSSAGAPELQTTQAANLLTPVHALLSLSYHRDLKFSGY